MKQTLEEKKEQLRIETETKANRYLVWALSAVVLVLAVVWVLNELEIFELNKNLVRICAGVSFAIFNAMLILSRNERFSSAPSTKYIIIGTSIAMVFLLAVMLNMNATLALVIPILLATQYSSYALTATAVGGSALCAFTAPACAYLAGTWNYKFLTGYLETVLNLSIISTGPTVYTKWQSVGRILMFLGFPQAITVLALGVIIFAVTGNRIENYNNQLKVLELTENLAHELEKTGLLRERTVMYFSDLIENRDSSTGGHVRRSGGIVSILMDAMLADPKSGISCDFADNMIKYAPMHDIGKIAISDSILCKPGRLTAAEYEIIKTHTVKSARIIRHILAGVESGAGTQIAENIALYHHERPDGTGYPEGLKGEEIPLEARIMAIADVYDALVSERCYKKAMSFEEAYEEIEKGMGTQFDAALNPYFISSREKIESFYSHP